MMFLRFVLQIGMLHFLNKICQEQCYAWYHVVNKISMSKDGNLNIKFDAFELLVKYYIKYESCSVLFWTVDY